jgi:hypothetical protein
MKHSKAALVLITPSWVSTLLGLVVGLGLTIGTIAVARYQGSQLQQEIFEVHANNTSTSTNATYHNITTHVANNHVIGVAPLFLLWAFVGLIVYYFAVSIVSTLGHAVELHDEMNYVNASRSSLMKTALGELAIRIVALAAWFGFIKVSLSVVLPYALAAAYAAAGNLASPSNLGTAVLAVLVLFADVYLQAVFFRLVVLKPRVFSNSLVT